MIDIVQNFTQTQISRILGNQNISVLLVFWARQNNLLLNEQKSCEQFETINAPLASTIYYYNQMERESGSIEVIYGPMFSGKSTQLLRTVRRFGYARKKCLVINYSFDNRYSQKEVMSTHDKQMCSALKCVKLSQIKNTYQQYDAIAIDEGQFFSDIVEMCEEMANNGKIVIVSGLDGTFERKPFGNILQLVSLAQKVTKLNSICVYCCQLAAFTHRTVASKDLQLIGGEESYKPVCRNCYFKHQKDVSNSSTSSNSPKCQKKEYSIEHEGSVEC